MNNELMQMLINSGNPQQFVYNMINAKMGENPLFKNLLSLAQQNKTQEIEQIARNMLRERGMDYDKEFNQFKRSLNLK